MKKLVLFCTLLLVVSLIVFPALADGEIAEPGESFAVIASVPVESITAEPIKPDPESAPWTWAYLATIAGATAATLLIAEFLKFPLDKVWKIPTRLLVYLIALVVMVVATAFTSGITLNSFLLAVLNAFVVALSAYGSYEVTFARAGK